LSCRDRTPTGRTPTGRTPTGRTPTGRRSCRRPAATLGLVAVALLAVSGCASDPARSSAGSSAAPTTRAAPADELTQRIAEVESARQCAVTSQSFADEEDITTDLDTRLAAAGLTHAQWKDWHDALVDSPDLVAQLTEVSAPGCTGG
jgi:hypothetical protein